MSKTKPEKISTRAAYGQEILCLAEQYPNFVVLDGDISRSMYTVELAKKYPNQHLNVGIAEQNQMATAAGLALGGYLPIVSSYAVFASMRALEQVRTSICYPKLNVKIVASHGGVTPGNDGPTHQGIEDLGLMRTLPNMTVIMPADGYSVQDLLQQACQIDGPVYFRLTRDPVPYIYDHQDMCQIGKANVVAEGVDVTIIAIGDMLQWALQAREQLIKDGISVRILDMHTLKPLDQQAVIQAARDTGAIVTVEDHTIINGLGSAVAEVLVENCLVPMKRIGLQDTFAESGPYERLLEKYGMSTSHICQAVRDVLSRKNS